MSGAIALAALELGAGFILSTILSREISNALHKSHQTLTDNPPAVPCAKCGEVGCFNVPEGADPEEFKRQLKEQEDALNEKSPEEVDDNIKKFKDRPDDGADRVKFRKRVAKQAYDDAYENALAENKSAVEADQMGQQASKDALAGKDATHAVDWVAGGDGTLSGMGDSDVNRSIGSQWNQKAPGSSISRREALKAAVEAAKKAGKAKLEIKLDVC